jgi:hypothetical protein
MKAMQLVSFWPKCMVPTYSSPYLIVRSVAQRRVSNHEADAPAGKCANDLLSYVHPFCAPLADNAAAQSSPQVNWHLFARAARVQPCTVVHNGAKTRAHSPRIGVCGRPNAPAKLASAEFAARIGSDQLSAPSVPATSG